MNEKGLGFYDRLAEGPSRAGSRRTWPSTTGTPPQALEDRGGWRRRDTAEAFADYASLAAERLGEGVATHNEPFGSAFVGHLWGKHAPLAHGLNGRLPREPPPLALARAGGAGGARLRARCHGGHRQQPRARPPASTRPEDAAASRLDAFRNRWLHDPISGRGYPEKIVRRAPGFERAVRPEDHHHCAAHRLLRPSTTTAGRWSSTPPALATRGAHREEGRRAHCPGVGGPSGRPPRDPGSHPPRLFAPQTWSPRRGTAHEDLGRVTAKAGMLPSARGLIPGFFAPRGSGCLPLRI